MNNTKRNLIIAGVFLVTVLALSMMIHGMGASAKDTEIEKLAEQYTQAIVIKQEQFRIKDQALAQAADAQKHIDAMDKLLSETARSMDELRRKDFTSGEGKTATKQN